MKKAYASREISSTEKSTKESVVHDMGYHYKKSRSGSSSQFGFKKRDQNDLKSCSNYNYTELLIFKLKQIKMAARNHEHKSFKKLLNQMTLLSREIIHTLHQSVITNPNQKQDGQYKAYINNK